MPAFPSREIHAPWSQAFYILSRCLTIQFVRNCSVNETSRSRAFFEGRFLSPRGLSLRARAASFECKGNTLFASLSSTPLMNCRLFQRKCISIAPTSICTLEISVFVTASLRPCGNSCFFTVEGSTSCMSFPSASEHFMHCFCIFCIFCIYIFSFFQLFASQNASVYYVAEAV